VSTELHEFEDILLDDNDNDTENLYEPQCNLTPPDFLDFQHSDIYLEDEKDDSTCDLYNETHHETHPPPEPLPNFFCKKPMTF